MFTKHSRSILILTPLLVASVVLSACAPAGTAVSTPAEERKIITVVGQGEAKGNPDQARVNVGVDVFEPEVSQAVEKNEVTIKAIMEALAGLGIAQEDIQTSNYSLYAEQRYGEQGAEGISGYRVSNQVSVIIRDIARDSEVYRDDVEWNPKQVSECLKAVRAYCDRRGYRLRYVWVLEKTKRERPHYHLLLWLPRREKLPLFDKRGWWPHGWTNVAWARKAVGYIAKYASKAFSAFKVKGARLYGVGGLDAGSRDVVGHWHLSKWLREQLVPDTRADRVSFVGWVSRATGEVLRSPWRVTFQAGFPCVVPA